MRVTFDVSGLHVDTSPLAVDVLPIDSLAMRRKRQDVLPGWVTKHAKEGFRGPMPDHMPSLKTGLPQTAGLPTSTP